MEKKMTISVFAGETEQKVEPAIYVGNLGNLGLGKDQDGISSSLIEEDFNTYATKIASATTNIEDKYHIACIDGRCTICQINGEKEVARSRIAGGILSYDVAAILSDSSLSKSLSDDDSIMDKFAEIEKFANVTLSIAPSSHSGGCGAANGLIDHLRIINSDKIAQSTAAVFDLVGTDFKTEFSSNDYDQISTASVQLADELGQQQWSGNDFVSAISNREPSGVEQLDADTEDRYSGHKEQSIILVKGNKTVSKRKLIELGLGQAFVININLVNDMAVSLSGLQGQSGYSKALHALVSYQLAVAANLCNKNMPIFVV